MTIDQIFPHWTLRGNLQYGHYYVHFTDEEIGSEKWSDLDIKQLHG